MKAERVEELNENATVRESPIEPSPGEVEALLADGRDRDLSGLSEREKEIYVSVEEEGLSPSELAEWCPDLPDATTIRTILHRARKKRGELSD